MSAWAASAVLAAVFLTAAASKLIDRKRSRASVVAFGVPARAAEPALWLLIGSEAAIAGALLVDRLRVVGAAGAVTVLGILTAAATANLVRGRTPECACFGRLTRGRIGWSTVARNALLATIAADVAVGSEPGVFVGLSLAFGAAWAIVGPLRTRRPGSAPDFELEDQHGTSWSLERLLSGGRPVLLVFSQPACAACHALLPDLAEWHVRLGERLSIAVVNHGTAEAPAVAYPTLADADGSVATAYGVTATPSAVLIEPAKRTASALLRGSQEMIELVDTRFAPEDERRYPRRALIGRAAGGAAALGVFPLLATACGSSSSTTSSSTNTTSTPTKSLKVGDEYICHQSYALCTNAACVPSADDPNIVVCDCVVESGYSVGFKPCPDRAPHGMSLYSNFSTALATSGVRAMTCPKDAPWANCLDYPCELDPKDPNKARCQCALVKTGPSFTFGGDCDTRTCESTVWSGAHINVGGSKVTAAMKRLGQPLKFPPACPKS